MKIAIIAPTLPPSIDGIGDHTALLAAELAHEHQVAILTSNEREFEKIRGVNIGTCFAPKRPSTNWGIYNKIKDDPPDWLILQYNPFSYGNRGLNLVLPRVIEAIKRECPNLRLLIFGHERYVPVINWKFAIMTVWQRYQYRRLCRIADRVVIATHAWARELRKAQPSKQVYELPVGSNLPNEHVDRQIIRRRLGISDNAIVLGLFGTAHISRQINYVSAAARLLQSKYEVVVLYMGPDSDRIRPYMEGISLIAEGPLEPSEISRRISAVDIYTATFSDGVSGRRGSFFAGLQHGRATVGTCGIHTDPFLRNLSGTSFLLTPAKDIEAFVRAVARLADDRAMRERLGAVGKTFFDHELSWPQLTRRILEILEAPAAHD
jgi:glycosyltransferase involved in cell wall biosynthesis